MYNTELYHHGILGQKWGVRRYQNYDGTYTQKGLKRYNQAKANYDSAKENVKKTKSDYKSGTATKQQYKEAKGNVKVTKRALDKSYDKLKKDKMADQGKELYQRGKTITSNTEKLKISETAVVIGSTIVGKVIASKTGDSKLSSVAASTIAVGGTIVNAALMTKTNSENKKLRAYYAH